MSSDYSLLPDELSLTISKSNVQLEHARRRQRVIIIGVAAFVIASLSWGAAFFFFAKCLETFDPLTTSLFRCICATIICAAIETVYCIQSKKRRQEVFAALSSPSILFRLFMFATFFSTLGGTLIAVGELQVSSGVAGVITCIEPIACSVYDRYKSSKSNFDFLTIIGLTMGLAGTIVSCIPDIDSGSDAIFVAVIAIASLFFAMGTIYGQITSTPSPSSSSSSSSSPTPPSPSAPAPAPASVPAPPCPLLVRVGGQVFFASLQLLPVTLILLYCGVFSATYPNSAKSNVLTEYWLNAKTEAYVWILCLAVLPTIVAFASYYVLMTAVGSWSACVNFSLPLVSLSLGYLLNGEWTNLSTTDRCLEIGGACCALLGTVLVMRSQLQGQHDDQQEPPPTPGPSARKQNVVN